MRLAGVIPPLTTPFDDAGQVSAGRLRDNIARYEDHGVGGYLLLGSTGETPLLEEDEKERVLRAAREAIPAGRPMIAGAGLEATAATVRMTRIAADCGADLVLVVTPHYFGPQMSGAALAAHYAAVADASPVPVLLYDVPKFTHVRIPPETVVTLAGHENIVGLKDSSGDLDSLSHVLRRVPPEFDVICGSHAIFAEALRLGARVAILAAADVFPEAYRHAFELSGGGKEAEATVALEAVAAASRLAVSVHGIPGIKAAMDRRGLYGGPPRPPLLPLAPGPRTELDREIDALVDRGMLTTAGRNR